MAVYEPGSNQCDDQCVIACVHGAVTRLELRPLPCPDAGELLLRLRAVGLCGTDLFKLATGAVSPGLVLGHELVGEVCALGSGVHGFRIGDRVAVPHHVPCGRCEACRRGNETLCATFRENLLEPGGFAHFVLVRAPAVRAAARLVPPWMHDDTAVWMEPAACVLRGVWRAAPAASAVAVVLGAGGMGLLHLMVLKAERPDMRVLMVDPIASRLALARQHGADACTDPASAPDSLRTLGDGRGADVVFDTVGGAATLDTALALTREGGSVVLFAHAGDGERARFDINFLFKYERRVLGSYSGGPAEQARVFDLMCARELDPAALVTHRLPLARFDEGVRLARAREAIKVVFTGPGAAS
jgi:L-iditol 2-dehydrogenase